MAFIQTIGDTTALTASLAVPVTANTTRNNTILLVVTGSGGVRASSVADTRSNTWTVDVQTAAASRTMSICRAVLTTALSTADTITVTLSGAGQTIIAVGYEYSGIYTVGALDGTSQAQGSSVTTLSTGSTATLTNSSEMVFTAIGVASLAGAFTPPTGFTERTNTSAPAQCDAAEMFINGTAAQSATWTWANAFNAGTAIATYILSPSIDLYPHLKVGDGMSRSEVAN